ncbi:terminase large subunit domain-containing protein [Brevibacillus agri]|uniref:terminase large subunit domain-containing protein n=1 Tax=Brevibacillus agri TaxID=51101 RepID=UPI003D750F62
MFRLPYLFYLKGCETVAALTKKQKLEKVMNDFPLFCRNFIKIVNNDGELVPFILNPEQQHFIENMSKFNTILKSRQIGFSSMALAYCLWQAVRNPNTNYVIVSHNMESASTLFERLKGYNANLPRDRFPNLFPDVKRDNRNELFFANGSRIIVANSDGKDIGRGNTIRFALLSEMAFYKKDQEKVLLSVEQALARNPESKIVIESTANGTGNFYYELFMKSWKNPDESRYKAFFYNWFAKAYEKQFKYEHDLAEEWFKSVNKGDRLRERTLEKDEKVLFDAGCNLRFLMWRRWKLSSMKLEDFQQEYPSFPIEAFKFSGASVFDQGKVLERLQAVTEPLPTDMIMDEVPEILKTYINKGLFIFHLPQAGKRYVAGIDLSSGRKQDYSAISIFDREDEQVASFYRNDLPVYKFAELVEAIGLYYNYAYLVIERNNVGLPLIERLRKERQYLNLYKQKIFDQKSGKKKPQLGWTQTAVTKGILVEDLREQFEKGLILIHCKETLQQMQIYQEVDGKMGNKKGQGNHDDLVQSLGLAVQGLKSGISYV